MGFSFLFRFYVFYITRPRKVLRTNSANLYARPPPPLPVDALLLLANPSACTRKRKTIENITHSLQSCIYFNILFFCLYNIPIYYMRRITIYLLEIRPWFLLFFFFQILFRLKQPHRVYSRWVHPSLYRL